MSHPALDAAKLRVDLGSSAWLDVFGAQLVEGATTNFADTDAYLLGGYAALGPLLHEGLALDVYLLEQLRARDEQAWPEVQAGVDKALQDYRSLGVACSFGDWQKNVNAIARAFQPGGGLPPMVINCGGPSFTVSPEFLLGEVRPRLVEMVSRIEAALNR